jgi:hypothetical protein
MKAELARVLRHMLGHPAPVEFAGVET